MKLTEKIQILKKIKLLSSFLDIPAEKLMAGMALVMSESEKNKFKKLIDDVSNFYKSDTKTKAKLLDPKLEIKL